MSRVLYKSYGASTDTMRGRIKQTKVYADLLESGLSRWVLQRQEVKYLSDLVHITETIGGAVYGHSNEEGSALLAATNRRIIYVNTMPIFKKTEDISYDVVSGLTLEWVGVFGTLILHTRMGDFKLRTSNLRAARRFKNFVEQRCIETNNGVKHGQSAVPVSGEG